MSRPKPIPMDARTKKAWRDNPEDDLHTVKMRDMPDWPKQP